MKKIIMYIFCFSDFKNIFLSIIIMNDASSSSNDGVFKRKRHVRMLLLTIYFECFFYLFLFTKL